MNGAMVHGIRSTGASTAALVSVAAGGIDVYWCVINLVEDSPVQFESSQGCGTICLGCLRKLDLTD